MDASGQEMSNMNTELQKLDALESPRHARPEAMAVTHPRHQEHAMQTQNETGTSSSTIDARAAGNAAEHATASKPLIVPDPGGKLAESIDHVWDRLYGCKPSPPERALVILACIRHCETVLTPEGLYSAIGVAAPEILQAHAGPSPDNSPSVDEGRLAA